MNFDLIATILFILFFVVGPLLQRRGRGQGRRGSPPPSQPGRSSRPSSGPSSRPQSTTSSDAGDGGGPLSERLEEARRRVLEAMGEQQPRSRNEPSPPAQPSPATSQRPGVDWQKRGLDWQDPSVNWQEVVKPVESFMTTRPKANSLRGESGEYISAPPLRTERRRAARRPAKLSVGRGFGTGGDAIFNGIIWHEILSEPVSRRGNRRVQSRHRSR